jgi:hypothetical protein
MNIDYLTYTILPSTGTFSLPKPKFERTILSRDRIKSKLTGDCVERGSLKSVCWKRRVAKIRIGLALTINRNSEWLGNFRKFLLNGFSLILVQPIVIV